MAATTTIDGIPDPSDAECNLWTKVNRLARKNKRTLQIQTQESKPCSSYITTKAIPGCCILNEDSVIVCIRSEFLPRPARSDVLSHELAHGHHLASRAFDGMAVVYRAQESTGRKPQERAITVLFHQHVYEVQVEHGAERTVLDASFHEDFPRGNCDVDCWFEWLNKGVSCLGAASMMKQAAALFPGPMAKGIATICDLLLDPSQYLCDTDAAALRATELDDAIGAVTLP